MKCTKCGKEVANDSVFCEFCGNKIEQVSIAPNFQSANTSESQKITFWGAIKTCFRKYATFKGRASRAEYGYWMLFFVVICALAFAIKVPAGIVLLVLLYTPTLSVAVRRCHDTNHSGRCLLSTKNSCLYKPSDLGENDYGRL